MYPLSKSFPTLSLFSESTLVMQDLWCEDELSCWMSDTLDTWKQTGISGLVLWRTVVWLTLYWLSFNLKLAFVGGSYACQETFVTWRVSACHLSVMYGMVDELEVIELSFAWTCTCIRFLAATQTHRPKETKNVSAHHKLLKCAANVWTTIDLIWNSGNFDRMLTL